jgi:Mg-chelatase subunit ChlD
LFIVDVSGSVAGDFANERKFAEDLVSSVAEEEYAGRINVAAVKFHKNANLAFPFNLNRTRAEVLKAIMGITFTGGTTSAVSGFTLGLEEIAKNRRKDARLVIVLISDGNSQDKWGLTQDTARKVRGRTGAQRAMGYA